MKKIPKQYRESIHNCVDQLEAFPNCERLDITELKNHPYGYRMRVGRYRVLLDFAKVIKIIKIQEVKKRDERTY
jgi:mRNA interferase RelE/StbE